ncbi:MAG: hypothetical protein DRJ06_04545 [Candidatus Aminicenantes bacterium]|nr:MAG: hypothetical protein DRJ06_04545 [Candidatus Aminicenantes bacterium]
MGNQNQSFNPLGRGEPFFDPHFGLIKRLFFIALVFLVIRNVPLSIFLPPWSFGDEMAHFDFILKLERGKIPHPCDYLEQDLYLFYRENYDFRYITPDQELQPTIPPLKEMGFAGFSYEAKHPPLAHLLYLLTKKIAFPFRLSLNLQLVLFRLVALVTVVGGLLLIYFGLIRNGLYQPVFYLPLIVIALLAQDMYFSLNIDVFAFFFGSLLIRQLIFLYRRGNSWKNWVWLSLALICAMWVKATAVLLFGVVAIYILFMTITSQEKAREWWRRKGLISLGLAAILSLPWYVYNFIRFGHPFVPQSSYPVLGNPTYPVAGLSLKNVIIFFQALTRTIIRGEFIWKGNYFEILPPGWAREILMTVVPLIGLIAGFVFLSSRFFAQKITRFEDKSIRENTRLEFFFLLAGELIIGVLLVGYLWIGQLPYYQVRLSFSCLYLIVFAFITGWLKVTRKKTWAILIIFILLFVYSLGHTLVLGKEVFFGNHGF